MYCKGRGREGWGVVHGVDAHHPLGIWSVRSLWSPVRCGGGRGRGWTCEREEGRGVGYLHANRICLPLIESELCHGTRRSETPPLQERCVAGKVSWLDL